MEVLGRMYCLNSTENSHYPSELGLELQVNQSFKPCLSHGKYVLHITPYQDT